MLDRFSISVIITRMDTSLNVFFIYVRKSTDESNRQVLSIQAQLFELQEVAKREGLTVTRTFEESRTAKGAGQAAIQSHVERD